MNDLISRQALCEYALNQKDKSVTPNDIMRFPSAQPEERTEKRTETHACDLISRQAAIDADDLKTAFPVCDNSKPILIASVRATINHMPTIEPEPHWIPCSEKLPEANGRYLVTRGLVAAGALWNRIYIANYSNLMGIKSVKIWWQGNVGKSDFERLDDVLAWMPLPEPYREEGE